MGIFSKEEKVKFRDEEGNLLEKPQREVVSKGINLPERRSRTPVSKSLEREYYKEHPEKKHETLKKVHKGLTIIDQKIVAHNRRNYQQSKPNTRSPTYNNYNPIGTMFDTGMKASPKIKKINTKPKFHIKGGVAYPIAGSKKKKSKKSNKSNVGFDLTNNFGRLF